MRIAVIDDSEIILETVALALTEAGFEVVTMNQPERAQIEGDVPPDLILMDVNMDEVFGDDATMILKDGWGVDVPIYLFSDIPVEELKLRAEDAGADGYISKSWGTEGMVEKVREILGA